ncbi:unnamed protein product, partial [Symbiodinium natans]
AISLRSSRDARVVAPAQPRDVRVAAPAQSLSMSYVGRSTAVAGDTAKHIAFAAAFSCYWSKYMAAPCLESKYTFRACDRSTGYGRHAFAGWLR